MFAGKSARTCRIAGDKTSVHSIYSGRRAAEYVSIRLLEQELCGSTFNTSPGFQRGTIFSELLLYTALSLLNTMNTIIASNGTAPSIDPPSSHMQSVMEQYRPELEIAWVLLIFGPWLASAARFQSRKHAVARGFSYRTLLAHITAALLLVIRYHARFAATRTWPQPQLTDAVLFTIIAISTFLVEKRSAKRQRPIERIGFQVAVVVQSATFVAAWVLDRDAALFRAAVKFLNWFAWVRYFLVALPMVDARLGEAKNYRTRWDVAVSGSGCLIMWESGIPGGVPIFLGLILVVFAVERVLARNALRYVVQVNQSSTSKGY